jgi:hypothetical protein
MEVPHGCTANSAGTINTRKAAGLTPIPSGGSVPLLRPSPSKQMWKAYQDGLMEMIELDRSPTGLPEGLPQPIYVLHLADIAGGKALTAAKNTAWRFYRGSFAGPAVAIEVGRTVEGRQPRMTSLSEGHAIQVTFQQVSRIEHLHPVRVADYELRRLKIPGMLTAFWLKSHIEGKDLVVPIAEKLRGLKYMKPYPAETFLAILLPLALARRQRTNEPRK